MSAELLPCPFCGNEGAPHSEPDADYPERCFMSIKCRNCLAQSGTIYGSRDPSEWADSRAAWNRRAALATQTHPDAIASALSSPACDRLRVEPKNYRCVQS